MQPFSPLAAAYQVVVDGPLPKEMPETDFVFDFSYPTATFSTLEGHRYETEVVWKKKGNRLVVSTAIEGIAFAEWDGLEDFLSALNSEVQPYLSGVVVGSLAAAPFIERQGLYAPAFRFFIVCSRGQSDGIGLVFSELLFDRSAMALWLTRTVFACLENPREIPSMDQCRRLIAIEYGRFCMGLVKHTDSTFRPGLHENCHARGLDKLQ